MADDIPLASLGQPQPNLADLLASKLQGAVNWWQNQPSWLQQAQAIHEASNPNSLRPTDAEIDFASGMVGPGSTKNVAAKVAPAIAEGASVPLASPTIRAFHGSPHDFDAFDMSKIGTGEGAQAYGHGLYFAENEGTAKSYRDVLSGGTRIPGAPVGRSGFLVGGEEVPQGMSGHKALDTANDIDMLLGTMHHNPESDMVPYLKQNIENRIGRWRADIESAEKAGNPYGGSATEDMRALADFYDQKVKGAAPTDVTKKPPGRMYEVNINADPEHFLDWDKPLSEQHPKVQEVLEPFRSSVAEDWQVNPSLGQPTHTGQVVASSDPVALSSALRQAGIPGIKYLDQGSRGSGAGTSNYVVFDDKLIDILKKYGLAGLLGSGAMGLGTQQQPQQ